MTVLSNPRVRELNDKLRQNFVGGKVVLSAGVNALPDMVKTAAMLEMAKFDSFDKCNDPYGEHDFGAFELCNRTFFFKLEYYNLDMSAGSEDSSVPENTTRVLTLMLSDEY